MRKAISNLISKFTFQNAAFTQIAPSPIDERP